MWGRVREIVRKEFRQALREPRMRAMLFGPPLIQLVIFGFAVNLDIETTRIAWMDRDNSPRTRELRAAFEGSGRFRVLATPADERDVQRVLDRGEVDAVVSVLPGFQAGLARGKTAPVQVIVDGTDSNNAQLVSAYASQVLANYSGAVMKEKPKSLQAAGVNARTRVWFNPDLRSRNYFVPGVLVNIIMIVTNILTALAIVREKEIGTMEQLMVTPVRPIELMLGKTLPFAAVGIGQVVLITSAALLVFRIPFRGSGPLLLLCSVLFLLTTLGAGLFVSTVSRTQQQAMMASFFFTVPAFMLSGFAFPIANMPPAVQYLTYLNPLRYFMDIVRGIFLKGAGVAILWPQMIALLVFGVAVMGLSAARFRKKLD